MTNEKLFHQLGIRDALAEVFLSIRLNGEREALLSFAKMLVESDKTNPNPHAKLYLETNLPK